MTLIRHDANCKAERKSMSGGVVIFAGGGGRKRGREGYTMIVSIPRMCKPKVM